MTTVVILAVNNNMTHFWYVWTLLGVSTIGTCGGNLLLKRANIALSHSGSFVIISPWFIGAIACYVLDLIFFTQALKYLPVSAAVPVASGIRIAATAIFADVFFSEHLTLDRFLASSLIFIGILLMLRT